MPNPENLSKGETLQRFESRPAFSPRYTTENMVDDLIEFWHDPGSDLPATARALLARWHI